jgi:hypothetical protein
MPLLVPVLKGLSQLPSHDIASLLLIALYRIGIGKGTGMGNDWARRAEQLDAHNIITF